MISGPEAAASAVLSLLKAQSVFIVLSLVKARAAARVEERAMGNTQVGALLASAIAAFSVIGPSVIALLNTLASGITLLRLLHGPVATCINLLLALVTAVFGVFDALVGGVFKMVQTVFLSHAYSVVLWVLSLFLSVRSTPAAPGEFPWAVQVHTNLGACSGSLIAPQWVLTVGRCIYLMQSRFVLSSIPHVCL